MSDIVGERGAEYAEWLRDLKTRLRQVQLEAALAVNQELLRFYWQLGVDIIERQERAAWGTGFLRQLSADLRVEFPELKGFSFTNLKYIRQWVGFYSRGLPIGQQPVGLLERPARAHHSSAHVRVFLALDVRSGGVDPSWWYREEVHMGPMRIQQMKTWFNDKAAWQKCAIVAGGVAAVVVSAGVAAAIVEGGLVVVTADALILVGRPATQFIAAALVV